MADPILITSPFRSFGGSLSDLTLYGTQPVPGIAIGRATDVLPPTEDDPHPPASATTPDESDIAAGETTALLDGAAAQPAITMPDVAAPIVPAGFHADDQTIQSPAAPVGSGSFVMPPVATPLQVVGDAHDAPAAPSVLTLDGVDASLAPAVDAVVGGTVDALSGITDTVAGTVQSVIGQVAPSPEVVTSALGDVTGVVNPVIDHLTLESFGGTNPAAGLTTLVGMVESADAFDLGHAVTPALADTAPGSILDALATDAMLGPLLGEDDGGHVATDHVLDDHGIHVL